MYGHTGKILRVNLTKNKIAKEEISEEILRFYIGGKGLGAKILYDELKPNVDPLSPENKLIFSVGPVNGTNIPLSSRYCVTFKSPLTGGYAESLSGGHFPPRIKWAGYDAIIIEGRSEKPVYLWIDDDNVEIRNASHLWGRDTFETEDMIKEELGDTKDIKVACIGPAGENLVRYACICNDYWRQAGRCGAGAVMGSKKLKAIAIRGTKEVELADVDAYRELIKEIMKRVKEDPLTSEAYPKRGTPGMVISSNTMGFFPTRHWHKGVFEKYEEFIPDTLWKRLWAKSKGCYACPSPCGKLGEIKEGPYAGLKIEGPEYETIFSFAGLCEIDKLEDLVKINDLCDRLGMDTISAGNVIAFAMEAYEAGKLRATFPIRFGDSEVVIKLLEMIAKRQGIGDLLAEGVKRISEKLGLQDRAIHVKGLEPAGYDPRALRSMALAFAVSTRGACHLRACAYALDISGKVDRFSESLDRVALIKDWEDRFAVMDSMVLCRFGRTIYDWDMLTKLYNTITGLNISVEELKKTGERIVTLTRMFNVREGFTRKEDILPPRFFKEPLENGPAKGQVVTREGFEKLLDEYYKLRGWDAEGKPLSEKLSELKITA